MEHLDNNIAYSEYLAENLDKNISYTEYIAEHVDNNIAYTEYIAEHIDNNIAYAEYIAENVSDTQAYMNYIAEGLDNTMDVVKTGRINENNGQVQLQDMKNITNVSKYYDNEEVEEEEEEEEEEDQIPHTGSVNVQPVQPNVQPQGQPVQPIQGQPVKPIQGQPIVGEPVQATVQVDVQGQPSVQGQPVSAIVTGSIVSVGGDQTGEVIATDTAAGIVIIKLDNSGEEVSIAESKVTLLTGVVTENADLKNYIGNLITETKKRKVSAEKEPHFLQFLTEKNKQVWHSLSSEDKDSVKIAINESGNQLYTEAQVVHIIKKTLSKEKPASEILFENMPASLKPVWESMSEDYKTSVMNQSKLYANLNTPAKIEAFWESRNLEKYLSINESKKVINENMYDNNSLSDDYINSFIARIKKIG